MEHTFSLSSATLVFGLPALQFALFAILCISIVLFIWDRIRYDIVAALALFACVAAGLVPVNEAFSGFSDPVVITVAAVLIMSTAISRSGFVQWLLSKMDFIMERPQLQVVALVGLVMVFSAFMNNVGALAIFLPVAISLARKTGRPPSELLMPMAFGSLLGGLVTLIGTPPNLLIARVREHITGQPFHMFDFTPVGLSLCAICLAYFAVGWRLIPSGRRGQPNPEDSFTIADYISELVVSEESELANQTIAEIEDKMEGDFSIVGLVRDHYRRLIPSGRNRVKAGDTLIVESEPAALSEFVEKFKLQMAGAKEIEGDLPLTSEDVGIVEAIVTPQSEFIAYTPREVKLRSRYGVNLLAVKKAGEDKIHRLRDTRLESGDVIMLQGPLDRMPDVLREIGCLPLAERKLEIGSKPHMLLPLLIMAGAIMLAVLGIYPIEIGFLGAVVLMALLRVLKVNDMYDAVHWPVIVLLAAMIPVTGALESTGGSDLIAQWLGRFAQGLPPAGLLASVLLASMLVTPFLNNAATVLLMAPIAGKLAANVGLAVDPFLMAVAIGASCDFLTPIGHQSNTLVMGPGGYKFSDYWRMGLPLSFLIVAAGVPLIMLFWPMR